ncbi:ERF family protein [Pelagerythrobacter marinus]|uniref:ERF family protein n=1 Tax=Pelagerythrobacter marinus TaxID=538382 RepID=UPI002AC8BBBD|nr:ERF family protein [Pelagerythrobacter marinus]WPZ05522.1 ERF family protein [Pelagerythrobacter marinus]
MGAESKIKAPGPVVYQRIAAVQGELAQTGIGKDSENTFDRYKFRGIDAVYNALGPLLAKHGLCVLPRIIERESVERVSKKGDPMFYVTVTAEFDFVAAEDGSVHTIRTYGEAMDRSDKATNKAMSAAYKYAAFMAFAIPTEGDNDADASTPEVAARAQHARRVESREAGPDGMPDAEFAKLQQLIKATRADTGAMLKHYRVKDLRQLNQQQYGDVIGKLNEKLAAMAKAETDAKASKEPADEFADLEDQIPY